MAALFYLRLGGPLDETSLVSWTVAGQGLYRAVSFGTLAEAAAEAAGHRVVVLIPAGEVLVTPVNVPTQQRQRLRQAVPFALEEQLAADVEELHFALGGRVGEGVATCVVARERMTRWLELLRGAGIEPQVMVPETLALPVADGEWSLLLEERGAILRKGSASGLDLPVDELGWLLQMALKEAGEGRPSALRVFAFQKEEGAAPAFDFQQVVTGFGVEVREERRVDDPLRLFAQELQGGAPINLLQGDFSRREQLGKLFRPWRAAAAMVVTLVALWGGVAVADYMTLKSESATLAGRIESLYRTTFPDAKSVVDPRTQMEQRLKALRGGSGGGGLAALLGKSAPALTELPEVELTALRYKEGELDLEMTLADLQTLDQLKSALGEQGLKVEIQSANARADHVEARLAIR